MHLVKCFVAVNGYAHWIDIIYFTSGLSEQEKLSVSEVLSTSREHSETIDNLLSDHSQQSACIEQHAIDTFGEKYAVCLFYFNSIHI